MNHLTKILVFVVSALLGFLLFSGCESSGFDKRATLMPDSIGISFSQERYRGDGAAWRGVSIGATWNLK